ncbi:calcium-binding protein [Jannaschia sp. KMU-145]|uniref:calcium-binding protein n=1 Tax=Jannaschia halovivens TaxID=3388667 RepID=UPI00396B1395
MSEIVIVDNDVLSALSHQAVASGTDALDGLYSPSTQIVITSTVYAEATDGRFRHAASAERFRWIEEGLSSGRIEIVDTPDYVAGAYKDVGDDSIMSIADNYPDDNVTIVTNDNGLTARAYTEAANDVDVDNIQQSLHANLLSGGISFNEYFVYSENARVDTGIPPVVEDFSLIGGSNGAIIFAIPSVGLVLGREADGSIKVIGGYERFEIDEDGNINFFGIYDPISGVFSLHLSDITDMSYAFEGDIRLSSEVISALSWLLSLLKDPPVSPLVLDLDGDGIELTAVEGATAFFDMDVNGFAEATGWVASDDGLLALDLDGDGRIDDGSELFGDQTGHTHGFLALAEHDANDDGVIDAADAVFADLVIWQDLNADGISQAVEMRGLAEIGITSISVQAATTSYWVEGNEIRYESSFIWDDGSIGVVGDAFFETDPIRTVALLPDDFEYHPDVFKLPVLAGAGSLASTWVAMSTDDALRQQATDLVAQASNGDIQGFMRAFHEFVYDWAGVGSVPPGSRGDHVDARNLEFLEVVFDQPFDPSNGEPGDPEHWAAADLDEGMGGLISAMAGEFLSQVAVSDALLNSTDAASYEARLAANLLVPAASGEGQEANGIAAIFASVEGGTLSNVDAALLLSTMGSASAQGVDTYALRVESEAQSRGSASAIAVATILQSLTHGQQVHGTHAIDALDMSESFADSIIFGSEGNDILWGGRGANIYIHSAGDGSDTISEGNQTSTPTDRLVITDESVDDVQFETVGDDLFVTRANGEVITIKNQFYGRDYAVDEMSFADGTVLGWSDIANKSVADQRASGQIIGSAQAETYYHAAGDGSYTITDYRSSGDKLIFTDLTSDDAVFGRAGDDLTLTLSSGDIVTIYEHFDSAGTFSFDQIEFSDGTVLSGTAIANRSVADQKASGSVIGSYLGETYFHAAGDGSYTITDYRSSGDKLIFTDLTSDDAVFGRAGDDLTLTLSSGDIVTIYEHFDSAGTFSFDQIEFSDGATYSGAEIGDRVALDAERDIIIGTAANDTLAGGLGSDTIDGAAGDDAIDGGDHADSITGGDGYDTIDGGSGHDTVYGGLGGDLIYGGDGNDLLWGQDNNDFLSGGAGNDTLHGGSSWDTLEGGAGDDLLIGDGGLEQFLFSGEFGHDTISGFHLSEDEDLDLTGLSNIHETSDIIFESSGGSTTLRFDQDDDGVVDTHSSITLTNVILTASDVGQFKFAASGTAGLVIDGTDGIDILAGTAGNDTISGLLGDDEISGGDGHDWIAAGGQGDLIAGGSGEDTIYGEDGNDSILGGAGDDTIYGGTGWDTIDGGTGNDLLIGEGGLEQFIFSGEFGQDTISGFHLADAENLDLRGLTNVHDVGDIDFEFLSGNTVLRFDQDADGNLDAHSSITLTGTALTPADAAQFIFTPDGLTGSDIVGTVDVDTLSGTAGNDTISGLSGSDVIDGHDGHDSIDAGHGSDTVRGGAGDDTIAGGDNYDNLSGDAGNDDLNGGKGWDTINGGTGDDILEGEGGYDLFVFEDGFGHDTITDFNISTSELIDFTALAGVSATSDLIFDTNAGSTVLRFDLDNDGAADTDLSITLTGMILTAADQDQFVF